MADQSCCLLCLEMILQPVDQVDITTATTDVHTIQQRLEKYFAKEMSISLSSMTSRVICRPCWSAVSSFHEFCERVQRAHLEAANILQLSKMLELQAEDIIKKECDVPEETPLPAKRRCTRATRKTATTLSPTVAELPNCKVVLERLQWPYKTEKTQTQQQEANDFNLDIVKHEALHEECVNANFVTNDTDTDIYIPDSLSLDGHDIDSASEAELLVEKPTKKKTKEYSATYRKTLEADEYIAKHLQLSCCLCNIPLPDFTALQTHFRVAHNERGYVRCCEKKFLKRGILVDHLHVHEDPDYFKCTRCGRSMSSRHGLELHMKNHDFNYERVFKCEICSKRFFREVILKRHLLLHVPEEQKTHACPQCDKTFPTKYTMSQHLKLVHLNLYARVCDICGKTVKGGEEMRRHMDLHAGLPAARIQCDICKQPVVNKYALARHKKTMHTAEFQTPVPCPLCSKVSSTVRSHQQHMRYIHTMQRIHSCPLCDKAFKRKESLKEHMTTHTGDVLYTCNFCPRNFNSNANMYAHRKKMHPKEWLEMRMQKFVDFKEATPSEKNGNSEAEKNTIL